ncbi:hypothetical protein [Scatolibacter rhodanostii]|uniref:hypothetical protein n=1 Tax=Scatolibacter rhodanostii TaxID=2014781 RepID=UPI000C07BE4A|nr:hypothetical protein [Scatolibacter rhodanostii]
MKKIKNKILNRWDGIAAGLTVLTAMFLIFYVVLMLTGSAMLIEPTLAFANMIVLLLCMLYYLAAKILPVQKCWQTSLIIVTAMNFLLIASAFLLLLFGA